MATYRMPVRKDIFDYEFEPEGLGVTFRLNYNARADSWVLDVVGEVEGIRLSGGKDLFEQYRHLNVPPGQLYTYDLDGLGREADKITLGDRVLLIYDDGL